MNESEEIVFEIIDINGNKTVEVYKNAEELRKHLFEDYKEEE